MLRTLGGGPRDRVLSRLIQRLHRAELEHLREHCTELAELLDEALARARAAEDAADYWHSQAVALQLQLAGDDGTPGITRGGDLVVLRPHADDATRNLLIRAEHAARATRYAP